MEHVVLVIHLLLTLALIGLILLQRSEGGGLGLGTGGGMGNFASAQTTANILTKATQAVGGLFFVTSLILAIMASHRGEPTSILDAVETNPAAIQTSNSPEEGLKDDKDGIKKPDETKTPATAPKKAPSVPIGQ